MMHLNTLRIKRQRTKRTVHVLLVSQLSSLTLEHPHIFTPIDLILNFSHPCLAISMVLAMKRDEFQVTAKLPKKGCARLRLKDTCFVLDSHPSLISVSRLEDAKHYTLFGNSKCVTFEKDDHSKLM